MGEVGGVGNDIGGGYVYILISIEPTTEGKKKKKNPRIQQSKRRRKENKIWEEKKRKRKLKKKGYIFLWKEFWDW